MRLKSFVFNICLKLLKKVSNKNVKLSKHLHSFHYIQYQGDQRAGNREFLAIEKEPGYDREMYNFEFRTYFEIYLNLKTFLLEIFVI